MSEMPVLRNGGSLEEVSAVIRADVAARLEKLGIDKLADRHHTSSVFVEDVDRKSEPWERCDDDSATYAYHHVSEGQTDGVVFGLGGTIAVFRAWTEVGDHVSRVATIGSEGVTLKSGDDTLRIGRDAPSCAGLGRSQAFAQFVLSVLR